MADGCAFGLLLAGANTAHDNLAGIQPDADFYWRIARFTQTCRVATHLALHFERRVQTAMGVVLARDRCAKQREDTVAGRLHDIAVIMSDGVDHETQGWIDQCPRFLGIEFLQQVHRPFDVGEQRRDSLALAVKRLRQSWFRSYANVGLGPGIDSRRRWRQPQRSDTLPAEL